jgi:hypothetical protein
MLSCGAGVGAPDATVVVGSAEATVPLAVAVLAVVSEWLSARVHAPTSAVANRMRRMLFVIGRVEAVCETAHAVC